MDKSPSQITIIGAGVTGVTTGVVLQLLGYHTRIVAKDRADQPLQPDDPEFASLFPSASVIPHSVYGDAILDYFQDSQRFFELLLEEGATGVSLNRHFEIFEYTKEVPAYLSLMKNVRHLSNEWQSQADVPHLPETEYLKGWSFDCLFTDWPLYLPQLFSWYQQLGGQIGIREVHSGELKDLSSIIINCTGLAGRTLFGDTSSNTVLKGHLVQVNDAPQIRNARGQTISYNYNPTASRYADAAGNAQDVYCYPRKDGWIIGGSRLEGTVDGQGTWKGLSPAKDFVTVGGAAIPAPIINLNRAILKNSYNLSFDNFKNRNVTVGYRYIRSRGEGLRVEPESFQDLTVIHNYGHGGAGVTLSWGTAAEVARLVKKQTPIANLKKVKNDLFARMQNFLGEMTATDYKS